MEAKKTYNTAGYFKFSLRYSFNDKSAIPVDLKRISSDDEFSNRLTNKIMELWSQSEATKEKFEKFNKNIQYGINQLMQIKGINDKFKFKPIKNLPDDFEEMSKVFNFYLLEWINKLIHFKSSYLYSIVTNGSDKNELERISSNVKNIHDKIKSLCGQTKFKPNEILNMNFVDKFKRMYSVLVSTDEMENGKGNRQNLFKIKIDKNDNDVR